MVNFIFYSLTIFCVGATLIPFLPSDKWYVRGFEFPFAQVCFVTLVTLFAGIVFLPFSSWLLIAATGLLLSFLYQLRIILPYTPLTEHQVMLCNCDDVTIKLLSCNVLMGNKKVDQVLSLIDTYDPDMILLIESNQWWQDQTKHLRKRYQYQVSYPLDNTYGMILLSKLELIEPMIEFLVEPEVPSIRTKVQLGNQQVQLRCLHPAPPSPTENNSSVERDAELLIVAKQIKQNPEPHIVIGDLNDVAWSPTTRLFQKVSGLLDPRIGRGFFNTFHASLPLLRWPLDHIFHSNHFTLKAIERGPHVGSDHFPIYAELCYHPQAPLLQEEPKAKPQELEIANGKIEAAF